jgi:hypothetical protein
MAGKAVVGLLYLTVIEKEGIAMENKILGTTTPKLIKYESLLEGVGIHMPQYHSYKSRTLGKVNIVAASIWRRLLPSMPYFVGDIVRFKITIENFEKINKDLLVFEKFGENETTHGDITTKKTLVNGTIIPAEGDVVYSIGVRDSSSKQILFTARVINRDTIFFQWFWFFLGAFVTFLGIVLAWGLGFIS